MLKEKHVLEEARSIDRLGDVVRWLVFSLLFLMITCSVSPARTQLARGVLPWWKQAVLYQVYVRSFYDSNGDGIGDLNGVSAKLDYLQSLGVNAVWLSPVYPSPQIDTGYDIANFTDIDREYGTLQDFDRLVAAARKRHIRIIMDMVLTHTSDKHPWFVESSSSRSGPKADWYIWADGKSGGPPNNWRSFDTNKKSAWQYVPARRQYYYHLYDHRQPALNWRSISLKNAMYKVIRFWLDRGVAGFRLDSASFLYVDRYLRNNTYSDPPDFNEVTYGQYTWNLRENHQAMRQLRHVLSSYPGNRVLIGETSTRSVDELKTMFGPKGDEIQLPMNFPLFWTRFSAPAYGAALTDWEQINAPNWPLLFFSNHDFARSWNRLGDATHNAQIASVTAALLLTLRGTPIVYYGEEIGLESMDAEGIRTRMENSGRILQPPFDGRDGNRTPMQWSGQQNAGFTTGNPWLPLQASFSERNVTIESGDPDSLLSEYRQLIRLRACTPALREGHYTPLQAADDSVLTFIRKGRPSEPPVIVMLNMSDQARIERVDLRSIKPRSASMRLLYVKGAEIDKIKPSSVSLSPYGIFIAELR